MPRTPRVIFVRHGETEWSLNGRYTSVTDLPLTENGRKRVLATGKALIGDDRLIVPEEVEHIFVSPRIRARQTLELLLHDHKEDIESQVPITVTEDIREWDYGDYEGLKTQEIKKLRKDRGLNISDDWSIWSDGCEGGELPQDVEKRLDRLITQIVAIHEKAIKENRNSEVVIVAHGHILRSLVLRWVKRPISMNPSFILEAGGVGVLSYEHNNCSEPAICLGGAFTVPNEF